MKHRKIAFTLAGAALTAAAALPWSVAAQDATGALQQVLHLGLGPFGQHV